MPRMRSCGACTSAHECAALAECKWCGGGPLIGGTAGCFETALWECPRDPACFRAGPEELAIEPVAPSWSLLAVVGLIVTATAFALFRWWRTDDGGDAIRGNGGDTDLERGRWWRRHFRRRSPVGAEDTTETATSDSVAAQFVSLDEFTPSTTTVTTAVVPNSRSSSIDDAGSALSERLATYEDEDRGWRRRLVFKAAVTLTVAPLVFFGCLMLLLSIPTAPTFDVCDARWDLTSVHKFERTDAGTGTKDTGIRLKAELHISLYNPNRFDVDLARAKGVIAFHRGTVATFEWVSRIEELTPIPAGSVFDSRLVVTVEKLKIDQVEQLVADFVTPQGVVLQLNAEFFVSLKVHGVPLTPRFAISDNGIMLVLNQIDDSLCKCGKHSNKAAEMMRGLERADYGARQS